MSDEIQLISDGDGLAIIGSSTDIDRFLADVGVESTASIEPSGAWAAASVLGGVGEVVAQHAAASGRWVMLTEKSADAVAEFGFMATDTPGVVHAMIGQPGNIQQWVQIAEAPTKLLGGPMVLPTIASAMAQYAMQRQIEQLGEYLAVIDEKVDAILRAQKDSMLSDMIGIDLVIEDAEVVSREVGRVSDVTWSKIQAAGLSIARTQAYAVRQLDALADDLGKHRDLGDIAKATKFAEPRVREWLAVIAHCFSLSDRVAILELERILDAAPEDLDSHRIGLRNAREQRVLVIGQATSKLLGRMDDAVQSANKRVLLNPFDAPAVVGASNRVSSEVLALRDRLAIESSHEAAGARRWLDAAGDLRDKVVETGASGVTAVATFGDATRQRAASTFERIDEDGDGVPDRTRAAIAADEAGTAIKGAASDVSKAFGKLFRKDRDTTDSPNGELESGAGQGEDRTT